MQIFLPSRTNYATEIYVHSGRIIPKLAKWYANLISGTGDIQLVNLT